MKKLIRQWLCEHKNIDNIKQILLIEKDNKTVEHFLDIKRWDKCKDCEKIIYSHIKY